MRPSAEAAFDLLKVGITGLGINLVGAVIYWRGTRGQIDAATATMTAG